MIAAVDSMEMRKKLFEMSSRNQELFIDFRMSGNTLKVYAFDPTDEKRRENYAGSLYSSAETTETICGTKTFAPMGALCGAIATQYVTKHLREDDNPPVYMEVDFDRFDFIPLGLPPIKEDE